MSQPINNPPDRTAFLQGDSKLVSWPWLRFFQNLQVGTSSALNIATDDALLFYVPGTLQADTHPVKTAVISTARTVRFQAQVGTAPAGASIIVLITAAPLTAPDTPVTLATLTIPAGDLESNVAGPVSVPAGSIVNLVVSQTGVNPDEGAYLLAGPVTP